MSKKEEEDPDLIWLKEQLNIKDSDINDWVKFKLREQSATEKIFPCVKISSNPMI